MCGIVGLFLRDPALEPRFGALLAAMLETMTDRGPDSAGFAIYGADTPGALKITVRMEASDPAAVAAALAARIGVPVGAEGRAGHVVFSAPKAAEAAFRSALAQIFPEAQIVSTGTRMEVYKEVGLPADVSRRFGLAAMRGTHGLGHTRMATESAVTTKGAHPFATGPDQCLVHNGSLSNHNGVRRSLIREGLSFETDNDSEVAAGYLTWRMARGDTLDQALTKALDDLDGFFTFVVGTERGFGVLRDPIACKPAIMAETDSYVAFGSEYRALAVLPGIDTARIWEPEPAHVYFWERAA